MKLNGKRVLVCDCEGTMSFDEKALAAGLGAVPDGVVEGDLKAATHLCRVQIEEFQRVAGAGEPLVVACTQEAPVFLETLDEMGDVAPPAQFTNIREKAGWSEDASDKKSSKNLTAKMSALIAEAAMDLEPALSVSMKSDGVALVLGRDERAVEAAKKLSSRLDVTLLLEAKGDIIPPALNDVPVFFGKVAGAGGHLGAFQVRIENFMAAKASSKAGLDFEGLAQTGTSECDLILDLRGGSPLFPHADKRDGYFNPDPASPARVAEALFDMADMVGTFEKARYVEYQASICAHSRSKITGCSRCVDSCPAGAITPDGDSVKIDPYLCGGCGVCASVCPTGAATYALPKGDDLYKRLRTLLRTYIGSGGVNPVVLVHDQSHGEKVIDLMARLGGGLPANVVPFAVNEVTQVGLDFFFSAQAYGAGRTLVLLPPQKAQEAGHLDGEIAIADAVYSALGYGEGRIKVLSAEDPSAVEDEIRALAAPEAVTAGDFLPMGKKRAIMNLALGQLHENAPTPVDEVLLPVGAPFGTVNVDVEGCTLCLSCVGACPAAALRDNPDKPQLSFAEDACVQCGLCKNTCPEKVISLQPRLSFKDEVKSPRVIKQEDPFHCIRCGKPYGTRASIDHMTAKLTGHSMFAGDAIDRLKMCDDCRVMVQFDVEDNPMAGAPRPITRTTDDYLKERDELRAQAKADMAKRGLSSNDEG